MRSNKILNALSKTGAGFTLIELLVVFVIIVTMSVALILNFRVPAKNKTARTQTASIIISDIRQAESMALSGSKYQNNFVCGYGMHYVDSSDYLIYAKALPSGGQPCSSVATRNYAAGTDFIVQTKKIFNNNLDVRSSFSDIFFEPPDPKIYVNNSSSLSQAPSQIIIELVGQADCVSQPCTYVNVYTSGQLDLL